MATAPPPPEFKPEIIQGATGPARAYSGIATALRTFNGTTVIVMAASRSALVDAVREINPATQVNPALFMPANLIHDRHIQREDDEL